jgi:hypothetical protein
MAVHAFNCAEDALIESPRPETMHGYLQVSQVFQAKTSNAWASPGNYHDSRFSLFWVDDFARIGPTC